MLMGSTCTRIVGLALGAAAATIVGCSSGKGGRTSAANPRNAIERVFQAHLPRSAANMRVEYEELMTSVVYGTFDCSESDLSGFLYESRLLPDQLTLGLNPPNGIQSTIPWWHPEGLKNVSGCEARWEAGEDVADCRFAAGRPGDGNATVYFMVVYENKKQTGFRSEVKADPNWPN